MDLKEALRSQNQFINTRTRQQKPKIPCSGSKTEKAMLHIEEIRSQKFSIGKEHSNPLTEDLHHAVTSLSAELYTKDVHFLMELIQNAEDNEYEESVEPTLEFVLTKEDITGTGSPSTLLIFNNEVGFSKKNMESLCSVGRSTKKGKRTQGFIGEKGIGFKSVFLVSPQPHVFSNGYQVRFREEPDPDCGIGYIVPEWVSEMPDLSAIHNIYGSSKELPATTFVVPLKPGKVEAVKVQLSELHPEILLFLSKVKRLYVREDGRDSQEDENAAMDSCDSQEDENAAVDNCDSQEDENAAMDSCDSQEDENVTMDSCDSQEDENVTMDSCDSQEDENVTMVSILSETNHVELSSKGADSRVVQLSVEERTSDAEETCKYFMWRQTFQVRPENRVSSRADVDQWIITLAFPFGKRLKRGTSSVGVFAFLPTAMVTNFPFVIQADFILASSRESILLDNAWNLGILECVPTAFVDAFQACVEDNSLFSSVSQVFEFLPAQSSSYPDLNKLRDKIRFQLQSLQVVPHELFDGESYLAIPRQVVRILPKFCELLLQMKNRGASLRGLSRLKKVLLPCLYQEKYLAILDFLGVASVKKSMNWYAKCMASCDLVAQASAKLYIELLCFVAENETMFSRGKVEKMFSRGKFSELALLKYVNREGNVAFCSISKGFKVIYASETELHSWLSKCNLKFGCPSNTFFLPNDVQKSLLKHGKSSIICRWLSYRAGVMSSSAHGYGKYICSYLSKTEPDLVLLMAHFLYHAQRKYSIDESQIYELGAMIPIIDSSGRIRSERKATLVPASGSNWGKLFGPKNPYVEQNYVDIGDVYAKPGSFLGEQTCDKVVLDFIRKYSKAVDLPELSPPDLELQIASSQLSSEQVFLLLDWLRVLRTKGSNIPEKFISSIRIGKWMKTCTGYNSPRQSILPEKMGKPLFDAMMLMVNDISIVDQEFYSNRINVYKDELAYLGVRFGSDDVHRLIVTRFSAYANSSLPKEWVLSLLNFIRHWREKKEVDGQWLQGLKKGKWLKTHHGYNAPEESIFLSPSSYSRDLKKGADSFWRTMSLPVVDEAYYGNSFSLFLPELRLLGVVSEFSEIFRLVGEKGSFPENLSPVTDSCGLWLLECLKCLGPTDAAGLIERIRSRPWLKTTCGFKCPSETIHSDLLWVSLARALNIPAIDVDYYGSKIRNRVSELKATGVAVDPADIIKTISAKFKSLLPSFRLDPKNVLSMLDCVKEQRQTLSSGLTELHWLSTEKWLKTRHGFKAPNESIIFSLNWGAISSFIDLPIVDDVYYGISIYKYMDELQKLGVIADFETGAGLVLEGLKSPIEPEFVTAHGTLALLECIKSARSKSLDQSVCDSFLKNIEKSRCLKTTHGFVVPEECVLFDLSWESILRQTDVPSIDVRFYDSDLSVYKDQLMYVGVKIKPMEVCSLISRLLYSQTDNSVIKRLYSFLNRFKWRPENLDQFNSQVWIPERDGGEGKWVNSTLCVLDDTFNLLGSRLYSLCNYYEPILLQLFSSAFGVREVPTLGEYLQLWNDWASSTDGLVSSTECCSFWKCILKYWKPETEETIKKSLRKVSATTCLDDRIHLVNNESVFIPDDLRLKNFFANVSVPLFVWVPNNDDSSTTLSLKLFQFYTSLGVKKISESVKCKVEETVLSADQPKIPMPRTGLIEKGLIKIVLCFLADTRFYMPVKERQEIAGTLLNVSLYECNQPIKVTYCLTTLNAPVEVDTKKMVFWDKDRGQLFVKKSGYEDRRTNVEFGSCFAQEISEGLLLPKGRHSAVANLSKIIHFGIMYEFNEDAVDHLLMRENLKLFAEDNAFLQAEFFRLTQLCTVSRKRADQTAPSTPLASSSKRYKSVSVCEPDNKDR